ncbi:hypothetical protein CEP48_03235 [Mergibacter septicus]|uniref:Uncharacterized protein n=1 Tax=Mergibacter septicus TaxID=221402 RepID=A0A8E3MG23_9PAST|nr:phage tail protein [Mergibacter septicus]AWX15237.1 hypothetical protein CEP47_03235 [Mergibacter septicus]QDJ14491.1 hypothetical protein CEP48_03235 [Mergibacter septicus]UTU48073.1 phage tail protein [Mergibacter septicus]WMR96315.1 phage tail protein [Mergibacter septicus]
MYLMLGKVILEPINLTAFSETQSANFAEHPVLKGRPLLQAMGLNLAEKNLEVRLHYQLGKVEQRYQALLSAKNSQQALAFIFGRGKFIGYFVITELNSTTVFTDQYGNVLCREISLKLKEYAGKIKPPKQGVALQKGKDDILGSIIPKDVIKTLNQAKATLKKGVETFQKTMRTLNAVRNTVSVMQNLVHEPQLALAQLPNVVSDLNSALGGIGELVGMQQTFSQLQDGLSVVGEFTQGVAQTHHYLQQTSHIFQSEFNLENLEDLLNLGSNALDNTLETINNLSASVQKMGAFVVLRQDEILSKEIVEQSQLYKPKEIRNG